MLQAMDIADEKIEQIFEAHKDTVNGLTEVRDRLQAELDEANNKLSEFDSMKKELVKVKAKAEEVEELTKKLADVEKEYEDYKTDIDNKAIRDSKSKAYKALLKEAGISEKRHEAILKVTDIDSIELDKDGNVKNKKDLCESIEKEWAEFKEKETKIGAGIDTPPETRGNDVNTNGNRAAMLAKQFHQNLYGNLNDEKKE